MSLLLWYRDEGAVENRAYGVRLMSLLLWYRDKDVPPTHRGWKPRLPGPFLRLSC